MQLVLRSSKNVAALFHQSLWGKQCDKPPSYWPDIWRARFQSISDVTPMVLMLCLMLWPPFHFMLHQDACRSMI
jgi:hypothetical protein